MLSNDQQDWLAAAGFVLTLVLFALSIASYWATKDPRLLVVAVAFALWATRLGINTLAIFAYPDWEGATWVETESSVLDFVTPALIFFAIVKREKTPD